MLDRPATSRGKPTTRRRTQRGSRLFWLSLVLPFVGFLLVFTLYPVLQLVRTALSNVQIIDGAFSYSFTGLGNFAQIGSDGTAHYSFLITALFILVTVPVTLVLGVVLAILVDRSVIFARVAHTLLLWPAVITPVVVSVVWYLILSPNIGGLNRMLEAFGLPGQSLLASGPGAVSAVMLVDVWHWTPLVFLLVYSSLKGIDGELLEAARVDGAGDWQMYTRIALPLLKPTIIAAALIRLTMGVKTFDEMYLLTHGGPDNSTMLVSLYIRQVFFDQLDLGYGAALSLAVIIGIGVAVTIVLLGRTLGRSFGQSPKAVPDV